jgi:hypothetical protein
VSERDRVAGHAFISYVREDSHEVDQLQRTLEAAGILVWRDTADLWPGENWRVKIRRAITDDALAFIACFSTKSLARKKSYQNEELVLAVEQLRQRRPDDPWLIPVRFDDCDIPDFDIGGGRTLASIQRADLFGDRYGEGVARLVAAILRILGRDSDTVAITGAQPIPDRIKDLLPYPERDIQLDDVVTELADACVSTLTDSALFPTAEDKVRTDTIRYVVTRADRYFDTVQPLAEALTVGCAWGSDRHSPLWRRTIEAVARTAVGMPIGQQVQQALLELRAYPVLLLVYSAGLAAVYREKWAALRAVTSDAQTRDETGRKIPVIGIAHVWVPFRSVELAANVLAFETGGTPLSEAQIEALRTGAKGRRYTPVSDHLQDRLRPLLSPIIRDDSDYDDAFDELEVLLAVIAADAADQADQRGQYLHGPWIGAFTWRRRFERPPFEQQVWEQRQQALLSAGFFGGDIARANRAFEKFAAEAQAARSRRF